MHQGIERRRPGVIALLVCAALGAALVASPPSSGTEATAAKAKCKKGKKGAAAKKCKRKRRNPAVPLPPPPARTPAQLAISPASHNFGFFQIGIDMPKTQNFVVSNVGQGLGGAPTESVTNDNMFGSAYSIPASTCGFEMAPFSSCTVTVQFAAPIAAQSWTGTLNVTANPGGTVTAALSGSS